MFVKVYILDAPYAIDRPFDYLYPSALFGLIHRGSLVTVPFGMQNRLRRGVVTELSDTSENIKVKPVLQAKRQRTEVAAEMAELLLCVKH